MMKGKLDLIFDWKVMNINAYIPLIIFLLTLSYSSTWKESSVALEYITPAIEFTIPVFAAWWSIFLFQDVLEEPGSETIFSYPIARWKLGITRVFIFFAIYFILIVAMLLLLDAWVEGNVFLPLLIQFGTQAFFFAGMGFIAVVLLANSGWALVVVLIYTSTQALTNGSLFPFLNIFLFNKEPLAFNELLSPAIYNILVGGCLWFFAQNFLKHFKQYK